MRYVILVLKFTLFVLVLALAVKNTDLVTVRYYFGGEWQAPLVFVLLVAFCAGIAAGLIAGLAQMFRQRREISALKSELRRYGRANAEGAAQLIRADGA